MGKALWGTENKKRGVALWNADQKFSHSIVEISGGDNVYIGLGARPIVFKLLHSFLVMGILLFFCLEPL